MESVESSQLLLCCHWDDFKLLCQPGLTVVCTHLLTPDTGQTVQMLNVSDNSKYKYTTLVQGQKKSCTATYLPCGICIE